VYFSIAPDLRHCPISMQDPEDDAFLAVWSDWKSLGLLPYPGGIGRQPLWVAQIIRACEEEIGRTHKQQVDALNQKAEGKAKHGGR